MEGRVKGLLWGGSESACTRDLIACNCDAIEVAMASRSPRRAKTIGEEGTVASLCTSYATGRIKVAVFRVYASALLLAVVGKIFKGF